MNSLEMVLTVLSTMITPAVLISACGSLTISTSTRLSRSIDRTRRLLESLAQIAQTHPNDRAYFGESQFLFEQLKLSTRRTRFLQRALTTLYLSLCVFVATSIMLGFVALTDIHVAWLPLVLGLSGAILLAYTCLMLVIETRVARIAIGAELNYALKQSERYSRRKRRA